MIPPLTTPMARKLKAPKQVAAAKKPDVQPNAITITESNGDVARNAFYKETMEKLAAMTDDHHIFVNIPVWGYPGHGKTSAILTAIHYCKAHLHGIQLALVTDADDLMPAARHYPQFKANELRVAADTTREFLGDLMGRFFRDNQWPDATEQPAQYLLELQGISGTLGFLILPDLRGGSYEASDEIAKNALQNAHAMVLLVNPADYVSDTDDPRSMDYKKEVLRRIQRCARERIPTCVMITMADAYGANGDAADQTEKELTRLLEGQVQDFKEISRLTRVSVIGSRGGGPVETPPVPKARKPEALVDAWIWTLQKALAQPREALRKKPPEINLRADVRDPRIDAPVVPTLRLVASYESSPGVVLGSLNDDGDEADTYLFQTPEGKLIEVRLGRDSSALEILREVMMPDVFDDDFVVRVVGSTLLVGKPSGATSLLYGARGQLLVRTSLPIALQSWVPVEGRRIVGISDDGAIHSLYLRGDTWEDTHHVQNLFPPTKIATCGFLATDGLAIVATGAEVMGVNVNSKGRFGDTRKPSINARFNGHACVLNRDGFFAAELADNSLVAGREKQVSLGPSHPEWFPNFALCDGAPVVTWATPAGRLRGALLGKNYTPTPEDVSPLIDSPPTGLCWNSRGQIVVVTLENGALTCFRRQGF